jgi:predicted Zn-dependent peptidase
MLRLIFAVLILISTGGNVLAQETLKLDNGITLIYKKIPNTKIVSVQTWIKTGSVNETEKENGISHFLEHLVFKGTKKYAPGDIDVVVEGNGGVLNAATSKDYTFYYVTIPSEKAETAFDTISEMVLRASFIPEEIEKEKPVVVQEIKRKYDRPTSMMWEEFSNVMFDGTPYAREVIGTEENVNSFTKEMITDYYNRFYHPENMTLVVVGDMEFETVREMAFKYFSEKRAVEAGRPYAQDGYTVLDGDVSRIIKKDISQEYGVFAFPAKSVSGSDVYSLEVLGEILSGGEFSELNIRMRYNKQLVNSVSGGYYGLKNHGAFIFTYNAQPGGADVIKDEIMKTIHDLPDILTDEAIEKAKNRLKSQSVFTREKSSSEANDIGYSYTLGRPDYYHEFHERVGRVTRESILSSVQGIFGGHHAWLRTLPEKGS